MTIQEKQKINELSTTLEAHIKSQQETDACVAQKIDSLMPLVELIPLIRELGENKRTNEAVNARFATWARILITIGGVITAVFVIIQLIFRLEK